MKAERLNGTPALWVGKDERDTAECDAQIKALTAQSGGAKPVVFISGRQRVGDTTAALLRNETRRLVGL